jgi:hypothetical protein
MTRCSLLDIAKRKSHWLKPVKAESHTYKRRHCKDPKHSRDPNQVQAKEEEDER